MRKLFVILVATLFVFAATLPAFAQAPGAPAPTKTYELYGDVRMNTFMFKWSKENAPGTTAAGAPASADDSDLYWDFDDPSSRFGALFKQGDISAKVEIRPFVTNVVREFFAQWNFGPGSFVVGQTWTPTGLGHGISGCCADGGISGSYGGAPGSLRAPMLGLYFPVGKGTLKFAALQPYSRANVLGANVPGAVTTRDQDYGIPRLEVSFDQKFGNFDWSAAGAYASYQDVWVPTDTEFDIDSYMLVTKLKSRFGPIGLNGQIWVGRNINAWADTYNAPSANGIVTGAGGAGFTRNVRAFAPTFNGTAGTATTAPVGTILDAKSFGWGLTATYQVTPMVGMEVGYFQSKHTLDNAPNATWELENKDRIYYFNVPINITKAVKITPEIGKIDLKNRPTGATTTVDDGDAVWFGAYWQITF